jgi:hypothetical protein
MAAFGASFDMARTPAELRAGSGEAATRLRPEPTGRFHGPTARSRHRLAAHSGSEKRMAVPAAPACHYHTGRIVRTW